MSSQRQHGREGILRAYHLKGIQLLLDLLSEHGCQTVTRGYLSPSVVLPTRPSIVELYPRAEAYVARNAARCTGHALRITAGELGNGHEVVFTFNCNGVGSSMPSAWRLIVPRSARCTRPRGVADQGNWRQGEVRKSRIGGSCDRRGVSGVCAGAYA